MKSITNIPFTLDTDAIMAQAHVRPESGDGADLRLLIDTANRIGRPKAAYSECFVTHRDGDEVQIEGVSFTSRALAHNLATVERVFVVLATCGQEMDQGFPAKGDAVQEFWWDVIKGHLLVTANRRLHDDLKNQFRVGTTVTMRPGSGDTSIWPIEQQACLFSLLGDYETEVGVELTESFLMVPNKTTSGIVFATEADFRTCEVCHRDNCPSRQAVFNAKLWDEIHADNGS